MVVEALLVYRAIVGQLALAETQFAVPAMPAAVMLVAVHAVSGH